VAAIAGPELTELCRARVQTILAGEERNRNLPSSMSARLASAALELTETFCRSAQDVTDEQVRELRRHLDPGQVFALVVAISLAERWYRLQDMLGAFATEP
jgi:alkylhydroperoxidase family enzyme